MPVVFALCLLGKGFIAPSSWAGELAFFDPDELLDVESALSYSSAVSEYFLSETESVCDVADVSFATVFGVLGPELPMIAMPAIPYQSVHEPRIGGLTS